MASEKDVIKTAEERMRLANLSAKSITTYSSTGLRP
jgi:hypothetical protein